LCCRYPIVIILGRPVAGEGVVIKLSSKSGAFAGMQTTAVLNGSQAVSADVDLVQNGNLRIIEPTADAYDDKALIFDGGGTLAQRMSLTEQRTTTDPLDDELHADRIEQRQHRFGGRVAERP
jgi:hypothetical protein